MKPDESRAQVVRRLPAVAERVFRLFASAESVAQWLSPSPEVRLQVLEFDFREHGGYRFAYHVANAPVMHVHGQFLAIDPPRRLVFSWVIEPPDEHAGIDSEVSVSILADGRGAILTIVHERLDQAGAA